jgi:hypothetical protein
MKTIFVVLVVLILIAVNIHPAFAAQEPPPISAVQFGDQTVAVVWSVNHQPPEQENALGLVAGYASTGFIAHDYLAGESIKGLTLDQVITLVYANGATSQYKVFIIGSTPSTTRMWQVYYESGVIIFQTCLDEDTRFIVKARSMELDD